MIFYYLLTVFMMSIAVGILYRIPRTSLVYASLTGTIAYFAQWFCGQLAVNWIMASFIGSVTAAMLSEFLARWRKKPATIYLIPGFIPLVPGREAYLTMMHMVKGEYVNGVAMAMRTLLTAGAIAFGIFVSISIFRFMINYKMRSHTKDVG